MKKIVVILVIALSLLMCSCEDGQSSDVNITNQVKQTDYKPDVTVTNETQVNDMPENTPANETTPTPKVQDSATLSSQKESYFGAYKDSYWEVDSLAALNTLMSNADGYAYYYIFEKIPDDLKFMRAGISPEMNSYGITFLNSENNRVKLFVFSKPQGYKSDYDNWDIISVDGVTYYYHQRPLHEGEQFNPDRMAAYFQWEYNGIVILVHPKEPITEDVIRKYNKLIKVEFNIGEYQVGMDTDLLLIKDMDKIMSLIRENPEIHFQTEIILMSTGAFC